MTWDEELEQLFDLPIFAEVRPPAPKVTADDRLVDSFNQINLFVDEFGFEPSSEGNLNEKILARTLKSIREDIIKRRSLTPIDKHNLLT